MRYITFLFFLFFVLFFFLKNQYLEKEIIDEEIEFFISDEMTYEELIYQLDSISFKIHPLAKLGINLFCKQKRLDYWFTPGRYILPTASSLNNIVNKIRSRVQDPVSLTFNSMDNIYPVFGIMESTLSMDSIDMINFLNSIQLPIDSLYLMLIPNTYEVFWDISPNNLFSRIELEYERFWNKDRSLAAKKNGLSKHEVFILASIVDKEASHFDEMSRISGLYLNRLKKDWPLAADPTIIYIWRNSYNKNLRRIRHKHIELTKESLFNTYHHKGLPPLPICLPSFQAIESVLYPETHDFLYMCAKPDNSEYHNFAKNHFEHEVNAAAFHTWLNKRKIY